MIFSKKLNTQLPRKNIISPLVRARFLDLPQVSPFNYSLPGRGGGGRDVLSIDIRNQTQPFLSVSTITNEYNVGGGRRLRFQVDQK